MEVLVDWVDKRVLNLHGLCKNPADGAIELLFEKGDLHDRLERINRNMTNRCRRMLSDKKAAADDDDDDDYDDDHDDDERITRTGSLFVPFTTLDDDDAFTDVDEYIEEQAFLNSFSWAAFSGNCNESAVRYLIDQHPEKISFSHFSGNTNDTAVEYLITRHRSKISWHEFCGNPNDRVIDFLLANENRQLRHKFDLSALCKNRTPRFGELVGTILTRGFIEFDQPLIRDCGDNPNIHHFFKYMHCNIRTRGSPELTPPALTLGEEFGINMRSSWNWSKLVMNCGDEIVDGILLPNIDEAKRFPNIWSNSNDKIVDVLLTMTITVHLNLHGFEHDPICYWFMSRNTNPRMLPVMQRSTRFLHMYYLSANPVIFQDANPYVLK